MPNSKRYRQLEAELNRLRRHFLPVNWSPTGDYSQRQLDLARAYRILAHAEIEFFVENVLLDVINKIFQNWKVNRKPSYVMTCLLAALKTGWQDVETDSIKLEPPDIRKVKIRRDDDSINDLIERAVDLYREIIKDNNGIKTSDLKKLLMPVGIALSDLDNTWLNSMNSFGGLRGFVAHTSRIGVTNPPDPKTEKDNVDNLLKGLKDLDEKIIKVIK